MQSFFLPYFRSRRRSFSSSLSIPSPPLFLFSSRCFNSVLPSSSFLPSSLLGHLAPLEFFPFLFRIRREKESRVGSAQFLRLPPLPSKGIHQFVCRGKGDSTRSLLGWGERGGKGLHIFFLFLTGEKVDQVREERHSPFLPTSFSPSPPFHHHNMSAPICIHFLRSRRRQWRESSLD